MQRPPGPYLDEEASPMLDLAGLGEEECPGADVSGDYAAFDTGMANADQHAQLYFTSATIQLGRLTEAFFLADKQFEKLSKGENGKEILQELGWELLWATLKVAPGVGPAAEALKSVKENSAFYAEALKQGIVFLSSTVPKTALRYKGPSTPKLGGMDDALSLLDTAKDVVLQEADIKYELFTWLRGAWWDNHNAAAPEPWTIDIEAISREMFNPITEFSRATASDTFEELMWRSYIENHVTSQLEYPLLSPSNYAFDGLTDQAVCYLTAKYGWDAGRLHQMSGTTERGVIEQLDAEDTHAPMWDFPEWCEDAGEPL